MLAEALIFICPVEIPHSECSRKTAPHSFSRMVDGTNCAAAALALTQADPEFALATMPGFYVKTRCTIGGGGAEK